MVHIKEKVEEGWIFVRIILELAGKPKEHVEEQMMKRIEQLKADTKIIIIKETVADLKQAKPTGEEEGLVKVAWTTFAEIEMLVRNLNTLVYVLFNYMPSSVEILEPSNLMIRDETLTDLFTDLQARLLQVDVISKQVASEVVYYKQSLNNLFKNYVTLLLRNKAFSNNELSVLTGVKEENVEEVMKILTDNGMVELKEGKYHLLEAAKSEQPQ